MQIVVDTSVWSLVLRRRSVPDPRHIAAVSTLELFISDARALLIGPVRQELLSGIKSAVQFDLLRTALAAFPDVPLTLQDYECAAEFFNTCKTKGIQGSHTDFLICAVASQRNLPIFTMDQDFVHFKKYLPVSLFNAPNLNG